MDTWQMQEAKANMSKLVKRALSEGPQTITVHGKSVAVVVSHDTYQQLTHSGMPLSEFLRRSPLYGLEELSLERDKSLTREIDL